MTSSVHTVRDRLHADLAASGWEDLTIDDVGEITRHIRERVARATYRQERDRCSEWIDLGGEGGVA